MASTKSLTAGPSGRKQERFNSHLTVRLDSGGEGVVRNVSASGIYFVTEVALQEGQPVQLSMEFDGFPSGPIFVNCHARVVRVEGQGSRRGVAASILSFEFYRAPLPRQISDKNG